MLRGVLVHESEYRFGALCRLLDKAHVSRIGKSDNFRMRMVGCHFVGRFVGDVAVFAAEYKELWFAAFAQHVVLVFACHHAAEQSDDAGIFGHVDGLGKVVDIRLKPSSVVGRKTCFGRGVRQQLLFAGADDGDFPCAVCTLLVAVGIGGRTEQYDAVRHLRMPFAQCEGDISAHGVADDEGMGDAESLQSCRNGIGEIIHRVYLAFDLRDAVPRQIERYDAHFFVEERYEIVPYEHAFEIAVQQNHCLYAMFGVADMQGSIACHYEFFDHIFAFVRFSHVKLWNIIRLFVILNDLYAVLYGD